MTLRDTCQFDKQTAKKDRGERGSIDLATTFSAERATQVRSQMRLDPTARTRQDKARAGEFLMIRSGRSVSFRLEFLRPANIIV